jgi:hypothetical protein
VSKYNTFIETGDIFIPYKVDGTNPELPGGAYQPIFNRDTGNVEFHKLKLNSDNIIDLPSKEYDFVTSQMRHFLKPETKQKYIDNGFLYKRSVMLHGKPGTGKTVIVNRVTQEALTRGAVVLFNPEPREMHLFFEALESTAPDKLTLVILEEFDDLLDNKNSEKALLSLLDGEIQKNNIIYLATTNYIDKVPVRMQRPGRFSSIIEVDFPSPEARSVYLRAKKINSDKIENWVRTTDGFSIDELKETVLAVTCLDENLDVVVSRLKDLKARGLESESSSSRDNEDAVGFLNVMESMLGSTVKTPLRGR